MPDVSASDGGVERRTLASQVYNILEAKILSGELQPGSRLSEETIAEVYSVSRSPAREALASLERVGLAVRVGMRDRMVPMPTEEMIAQKHDVWWIIDVGRTYLGSLDATAEDHAELRHYVDGMAAAANAGDTKKYRQFCDKFHKKIRGSCANEYMNELGTSSDLYMKWFERLYDRAAEISTDVIAEHYRILEAYEKRDLAGLSETIRVHLMRQRDRMLSNFNRKLASGARKPRPGRTRGGDGAES
jgi:DNA-binding GntR family transcriptional regulator